MRNRILGAVTALMFGLLGAAFVASPAQATGDHDVTTGRHTCDGVPIHLPVGLRIKVVTATGWTHDTGVVLAAKLDLLVPAVDAKVIVVHRWSLLAKAWVKVDLGGLIDWKNPGDCKKPVVDVEKPNCRCLDLIVKVTNVNSRGWIFVRFGDGAVLKVKAGDHVRIKARADVGIWIGLHPERLRLIRTVGYDAPEGCTTATTPPTSSPTPSPTPSPTLSPSPSPTGGTQGTPTPTPVVTTPAATTPGMTPSPLPSIVAAGQVGGNDGPQLPLTGSSVAGFAAVGGVLVAAGIAAVIWAARRRRDEPRHFAA